MKTKKDQHLEADKDWRVLFTEDKLKKGRNYIEKGQYGHYYSGREGTIAEIGEKKNVHRPQILLEPSCFSEDWNREALVCDCEKRQPYYYARKEKPCAHLAALLMLREGQHGPWHFRETDEEMEARFVRERIAEEKERREKQKSQEGDTILPVEKFFENRGEASGGTYFDVRKAIRGCTTNLYFVNRAKALLENMAADAETVPELGDELQDVFKLTSVEIDYDAKGAQGLQLAGEGRSLDKKVITRMSLSRCELRALTCNCQSRVFYGIEILDKKGLCEHKLALLSLTWDYIEQNNPGDATDIFAERFFSALDVAAQTVPEPVAEQVQKKQQNLMLKPKISVEDGKAKLSFQIGRQGGKFLVLKGFQKFVNAVEDEQKLELGKTLIIDFAKEDFTQESLPWLTLIQRRVSETDVVNQRLQSRRYSYYYNSISVQNQEELSGAILDRFYDLAENTACEYQDRKHKIKTMIRIGHTNMKVQLFSERIEDSRGALIGVAVTGNMSVILQGSAESYILTEKCLSRISREEAESLRPFQSAADPSGYIRFQVGQEKLAEFYYRVVPELINSTYVDFEDVCAGEVEEVLPPEPAFTFRLNLENEICTCGAFVSYDENGSERALWTGENEQSDPEPETDSHGYCDVVQENRVEQVLLKYFPRYDRQRKYYWDEVTEDDLYRILTQGIRELSAYGTVLGSEAFRTDAVRPMPQLQVGVSLESGLLDVSVLSKDLSPEELLEVLESYRVRKKYHRLKNGDFVSLTQDQQADSLQALADGMNMTMEELVNGSAALPAYRALYLDHMLEQHEELVSNRSRTYRRLIKNFHTIRDADYEVSDSLSEVMRSYQIYGYKWLRTLTEAGFGGILADEMGLGKTLQTIALFLALKEEGNEASCLVVCPASLVYNWQEEIRRFAPQLTVTAVAGSVAARKSVLKTLENFVPGESPDVCITSYDLLRKDIQHYEKLSFSVMCLDEAQYIKNQKAGLTKAVKVIRASHRFALTGTPIENRLAELWSIFDFLMPGFLFSYEEFSKRYETPITKTKDPAMTEQLKQMVGPFILRRLKGDVLKDLPAKLEEVRYARFDEKQRRVYDGQVVRMKQMIAESGNRGEDKLKVLAELTRLRQICCDPSLLFEDYDGESAKRAACLELIQNAIGGGHRMLVFSQFTSMLALLEEDLKREKIEYYKITGSTPKEQRIRMVHAFNENQTPVFLISLKAGGTGLNLTGADIVIHYDPWWNLAAQNQATDRAHRIGQEKEVTVYRMIMKDTIEEKILALQEAKKDLADAILSGESTPLFSLSGEELLELLG